VDKFHTLLYYEEHEHARVLKERYKLEIKILCNCVNIKPYSMNFYILIFTNKLQ